MAEYKSFHYLMHQVPEAVKPTYITSTALTFDELYSPRPAVTLLGKSEKSYWRTRDRIEYAIYEDRSNKTIFITCRNLDKPEIYRTIFLDAEILYFELEAKTQGNKERLTRKRDKKIATDDALYKAISEFVLARLNIGNDPLPWPDFTLKISANDTETETHAATTSATGDGAGESTAQDTAPVGPLERMCTFNKLASDTYENMEINQPPKVSLTGLEKTKTAPTVTSGAPAVPADIKADAESTPAAVEATISAAPSVGATIDNTSATVKAIDTSKPAAQKTGAATATTKGNNSNSASKPAGRNTIISKSPVLTQAANVGTAAAVATTATQGGANAAAAQAGAAAAVATTTPTSEENTVPSADKDKKKSVAASKSPATVKTNKVVPM